MRLSGSAAAAAALAVVITVMLGGGFYPGPRIAVGCVLIVVWIAVAGSRGGGPDRVEWLLAVLLGWGVFSAVWIDASRLASKEALTVWLVAAVLFGICRRAVEPHRRVALFLLTAGGVIVAAAVLMEVFAEGLRVGGLLENPNVAASLLVPTLPAGWAVLERRPRLRWVVAVVIIAGVVGTGSRAGLLALIVAVGVLLPRGSPRIVGLASASAVAVGVLAWRFLSHPDVLAWHRISIWRAVLEIWLDRPITGVGPGCLADAATAHRILHADEIGRYQFVIGYTESTPLAVLVQLGVVGIVVALAALLAWWSAVPRESGRARTWVVAGVASMGVLSLFHDVLTIDPVLWWWAVITGCAAPVVSAVDPALQRRASAMRWTLIAVMVWITAWGVVTPALARRSWLASAPTTDAVVRVLRIEPWLADVPAIRVRRLLDREQSWSWETAAEALAWAREVVRIRSGQAHGWADLGRVHLRIMADLGGTEHDIKAARQALTRACELDPKPPWAWLERARLERMLGNPAAAVTLVRHALTNEPNTVRAWIFLARLELDRGNTGEAQQALEMVAETTRRWGGRHASDYDREILHTPKGQLDRLRRQLVATGPETESAFGSRDRASE